MEIDYSRIRPEPSQKKRAKGAADARYSVVEDEAGRSQGRARHHAY
jgi:hypothetical protein